ncbi:hypothetical protein [Terrimonas alba]|uniref:hypothetical protein n=1 Tax=Terrimonas alba TaxID=3349636 RepID=UPI0035F3DF8A
MKKISSDKKTYYYRYILPFLLFGAIVIVTVVCIYYKYYLVLIMPIYWLIGSLITGKFTYWYRMSDVFIDHEQKIFIVINRKKEYCYPFSELKKVKSDSLGFIIQLKFEKKKQVLFAPPSDNSFGMGNFSLVSQLKALIIK